MKTLLQIVLICFAGSALAQTIDLPPRAAGAPTGGEFAHQITTLDLAPREREITSQIFAGNIPDFLRKLCPVNVTNVTKGITNAGTFYATPDYLAIGSDADYLLTPISGNTAQHIADSLNCVLPTRKMVDEIYAAAEVKLAPSPIPPTAAMNTVPVFTNHNETVRAQRNAGLDAHPLGALVAGHKKDVVVTARLHTVTNKIAIYGWHRLTNGVAIQPLYLGHVSWWADYSQCIRLVSQTMLVNGETKRVTDVLADPKICGLLSDEGAVTNARYPTNAVSPPVISEKINLPWPQKFVTGTNFGELTREIKLPDDVRIVINAPDDASFSPDKPVLLVFFSLPNGNSIEQTFGKLLGPGDHWRFDIQHIGAQTRWLRNVTTNRTIVVAYLEAGTQSWPLWRKTHDDKRIAEIINGVRGIFPMNTEVVLTSHSGGGSLMFGYLNAVDVIPDAVKRIAFLDSDYAYETDKHAEKFKHWLAVSADHRLCVLAYQDYLALFDGKTFASESGGTWGRSHVLLGDLQPQFQFITVTNVRLKFVSTPDRQIEFLLKENPEKKILHTVQVERNGFIQVLLSGTPTEGKAYEYLGPRAYTNWIR